MRHRCVLFVVAALLVPILATAAPPSDPVSRAGSVAPRGLALPSGERLLALTDSGDDAEPPANAPAFRDSDPRRAVLSSLHAVTGVVQTYDGMLTMRVLKAGGTETNPLMRPVARNESVMLGVKVAAAVATVIGTERLWHDNHRLAAILASAAANSAMAMIARHNAHVLAQLEGR